MSEYLVLVNGIERQATAQEVLEIEARNAAYAAGADKRAADEVRSKRDKILSESDWTQVADAPVDKAAWATYRQALRDIPSQAGFPNEVTWPVEP